MRLGASLAAVKADQAVGGASFAIVALRRFVDFFDLDSERKTKRAPNAAPNRSSTTPGKLGLQCYASVALAVSGSRVTNVFVMLPLQVVLHRLRR